MRKKQLIWAALLLTTAVSAYGSGSAPTEPSSSQPQSGSTDVVVLENIQYIPQQFRVGTSYNGLIQHGIVKLMNQREIIG